MDYMKNEVQESEELTLKDCVINFVIAVDVCFKQMEQDWKSYFENMGTEISKHFAKRIMSILLRGKTRVKTKMAIKRILR